MFSKGGYYYSPEIITNQILFSKDEYYSHSKIKNSKLFFGKLNNFSFADIKLIPDTTNKNLQAEIYLSPNPNYWLNYEFSINRSNILEFGIDISLVNGIRNLANMADVFEIGLIGTLGNYRGFVGDGIFKSFILGGSLKWKFPTFIFPFVNNINYKKKIRPRTEFSLGYNIQNNIGLDRKKIDFSIDYIWNENEFKEHKITLPKINYTEYVNRTNYFNFYLSERKKVEDSYKSITGADIPKNSNFEEIINTMLSIPVDENNKNYIKTVTDVNSRYRMFTANIFNPSLEYTFTYNNKLKKSDWTFFKISIETSGNLFIPVSKALNLLKIDTVTQNYNMFNSPISKYFKTDINFIKYWNFNNNSKIAFRSFFGIGIPLGLSKIMPYDKMYFSGGTNSERAWLAYDLGPGGNTERIFSLNVADIKLSFSLEYRYTIYKSLKGGLFVDAGNIWRFNSLNNEKKEDLETFKFNRFYKEFGIGIGNGFRYDFGFFIIRFDFAYKLYDPSKIEKDRFVLKYQELSDPTVQFGITYPF